MTRDDFDESADAVHPDGTRMLKRNPMDELKHMFDTDSMRQFRQQLEELGGRIQVAAREGRAIEPMGNWVFTVPLLCVLLDFFFLFFSSR